MNLDSGKNLKFHTNTVIQQFQLNALVYEY